MNSRGTGYRPVDSDLLFGRNAVRAALQGGRPLHRVVVSRQSSGATVEEIVTLARNSGIPVLFRPRAELDRLAGRRHQGVVALVAARPFADFEKLLSRLDETAFLVFLDRVQDPHNLGAVIRSACVTGADGVVIPDRQSAGLTGAVAKASAGAVDHIPVCRVRNLKDAILQAKAAGLWITGLSPEAPRSFTEVDYQGPTAIVVGGEDRGIRRTVAEACDFAVSIPMVRGEVTGSLNASVAAGIALFEVYRQRSGGGKRR